MTLPGEFHLIERLKHLIPRSLQGPFPIGDDAAILPTGRGKCLLFTTDAIVEGVDFIIGSGGTAPEQIGHKALAVNLSDIAAMGGRPLAFVVSWGIPKKLSQRWVQRIAKGMIRLARAFDTAWVGGDISRAQRLFISIALLGEGEIERIVQRKGARRGDLIYVTGELGGSIYGKHLSFLPRVQEADYLVKQFHPSAMIDISDGFIQDLEHLLVSSQVGARVDLDRIPISEVVWKKARGSRARALEHALTEGEDFELLFTLRSKEGERLEKMWPRQFKGLPLTKVGEIVDSHAGTMEWRDRGKRVRRLRIRRKGFTHF